MHSSSCIDRSNFLHTCMNSFCSLTHFLLLSHILTACPAGFYRSESDTTCQPCPSNTLATEVTAPVCSCIPGFARNEDWPASRDCLRKLNSTPYSGSSSSQVLIALEVINYNRTLTVRTQTFVCSVLKPSLLTTSTSFWRVELRCTVYTEPTIPLNCSL